MKINPDMKNKRYFKPETPFVIDGEIMERFYWTHKSVTIASSSQNAVK